MNSNSTAGSGSAAAAGPSDRGTGAGFATTRWTLVVRAGNAGGDPEVARGALEELCRAYWRPVYAFVRRQGRSPHDAQDLTQGFFAAILEQGSLGRAEPERGRFRSFLLGALRHHLAHDRDRAGALKRGGGVVVVPLDASDTDGGGVGGGGSMPASDGVTPERAYDRQWALALLDRVLERLAEEQAAAGKAAQFAVLRGSLAGGRLDQAYVELGNRLGLSEGAVKVTVHRLRQRYRELLRLEIRQTVDSAEAVEAELRDLFAALAS